MRLIPLVAAILFATAAEAQYVTVFGNTDAQRCFLGTKMPGRPSGIEACNLALKSGGLSKKDRASTFVNRGIHHTRSGQFGRALADFESALTLRPDLGEAFLNRGNTRVFTRQYHDALSDYDTAITLGTRDLHAAYFNRGLAYEALKQLDAAYDDFKKSAELKPDWPLVTERVRRYEESYYKADR